MNFIQKLETSGAGDLLQRVSNDVNSYFDLNEGFPTQEIETAVMGLFDILNVVWIYKDNEEVEEDDDDNDHYDDAADGSDDDRTSDDRET